MMDQVSRSAPFDVRVDQNLNYASLTHLGQELAELSDSATCSQVYVSVEVNLSCSGSGTHA